MGLTTSFVKEAQEQHNRPTRHRPRQDLPPFVKCDEPVVVQIDLVEEARQPLLGDRQASALKGGLELLLVQPAVLVAVDGSEQQEQLFLGGLDEGAEF